jgi:hypothetical protein
MMREHVIFRGGMHRSCVRHHGSDVPMVDGMNIARVWPGARQADTDGALGVDDAVNVWRVRSPPGWASGCVTKIDECAIFVFA